MKILVENSTWNNIGDAFYQTALHSFIKELYPDALVLTEEGPVKRTFRPRTSRQESNMFRLMNYQDGDLHIFSGPIIPQIFSNYKHKIQNIIQRGSQYALISVSGAGICEEDRKEIGNFLKKNPPLFFSSRDKETYDKFKEFVPHAYNGICAAFLVNRFLKIDTVSMSSPFFISSFYRELEPYYYTNGIVNVEEIKLKRRKSYLNLPIKYARHFNFLRPQQEKINDHLIIRMRQDLSTHFKNVKFSHPNSFMSFNPLSYLALYKSADFTISDRVHSCAVALAFGKPARLLYETPRAGIFEKLGLDYKKNNGIMYPELEKIDNEIDSLKSVIKKYI